MHLSNLLSELTGGNFLVVQQLLDSSVTIDRLHLRRRLLPPRVLLARKNRFLRRAVPCVRENWVHRLGDSNCRLIVGNVVRVVEAVDVRPLVHRFAEVLLVVALRQPEAVDRVDVHTIVVSRLRKAVDLRAAEVDRFESQPLDLCTTLLLLAFEVKRRQVALPVARVERVRGINERMLDIERSQQLAVVDSVGLLGASVGRLKDVTLRHRTTLALGAPFVERVLVFDP